MDTGRNDRRSSGGPLAGGIAAAFLAGAMALGINMGILGAIGAPEGPGRLGQAPAATSTQAPSEPVRPAPATSPGANSSEETTAPATDRSASPEVTTPSPHEVTTPSSPGWTPRQGVTPEPPDPTTESPHIEHKFGAEDDD